MLWERIPVNMNSVKYGVVKLARRLPEIKFLPICKIHVFFLSFGGRLSTNFISDLDMRHKIFKVYDIYDNHNAKVLYSRLHFFS